MHSFTLNAEVHFVREKMLGGQGSGIRCLTSLTLAFSRSELYGGVVSVMALSPSWGAFRLGLLGVTL